jgi:hypothetical protein
VSRYRYRYWIIFENKGGTQFHISILTLHHWLWKYHPWNQLVTLHASNDQFCWKWPLQSTFRNPTNSQVPGFQGSWPFSSSSVPLFDQINYLNCGEN